MIDILEIIDNKESPSNNHTQLLPKKIIPFWPVEDSYSNEEKCFVAKALKAEQEIQSTNISYSSSFWYNKKHKTLLKLKNNVSFFIKAIVLN